MGLARRKLKTRIMYKITIDPPSGWKYGFPKEISWEEYNKTESFKEWCIANGYPREEAESYGEHFYYRVNGIPPMPPPLEDKIIKEKYKVRNTILSEQISKAIQESHLSQKRIKGKPTKEKIDSFLEQYFKDNQI
jgi:hypothetical protein